MLIGSFDTALEQDDLTYAALRLATINTLIDIESAGRLPDTIDPSGFLDEVPMLAAAAPVVQIDLLADTWARHQSAEPHPASLLDAAMIYAACQHAAICIEEDAKLASQHVAAGPRQCQLAIKASLAEQFRVRFESFWGDIDFLTLQAFDDSDPAIAKHIKSVLGISNREVKKLQASLARWHAKLDILARLDGLLSDEERQSWSRWLVPPVSVTAIVGEISMLPDTFQAFLNRKTGEVYYATEDELRGLDAELGDESPDWQIEATQKLRDIRNSEDWLELPSLQQSDDWPVMADFCRSVVNDTFREDLLDAIRGSGAFGRFKNMILRHGLIDDWDRFRNQARGELVTAFLRQNGIAYTK